MRKIDRLLDEYGESHQNLINKIIHWIAVPSILWTFIALLWSIPFPFETGIEAVPVNWATIALLMAQIYWFSLSVSLGLGLLLFNTMLIQLTVLIPQITDTPLWKLAVVIFVSAWILQFIGHAIEKKRPSFFKDVQLYRALGIRY
jgi:uncharacterized membrane protein YGL010W